MRLEIMRDGLQIVPERDGSENSLDIAFIEEVLELRNNGDSIELKRVNAHNLLCVGYLEASGGKEYDKSYMEYVDDVMFEVIYKKLEELCEHLIGSSWKKNAGVLGNKYNEIGKKLVELVGYAKSVELKRSENAGTGRSEESAEAIQ